MKRGFAILVSLTVFFVACTQQTKTENNAMDVARTFIRASLDGNFPQGEKLLLQDDKSLEYYKTYEALFAKMSDEEKSNYKNASFEINNIQELGDTATIFTYSNSYMKKPMDIKTVRHNGEWKIDFKHTYNNPQ